MAFLMLPKAFKVNLKTLQKFEISHLGANTTNINIWVPLSFSHNSLHFSQNCLQMTLATLSKVLIPILKTLGKVEVSYFSYKWPWHEIPRLLKRP